MKKSRFMQLYTHVYDYCTLVHSNHKPEVGSPAPSRPPTGPGREPRDRRGPQQVASGAQFVGQCLYERLQEFLTSYLKDLLKNGEGLMDEEVGCLICSIVYCFYRSFVNTRNSALWLNVRAALTRVSSPGAEVLHEAMGGVSVFIASSRRNMRLSKSALGETRVRWET